MLFEYSTVAVQACCSGLFQIGKFTKLSQFSLRLQIKKWKSYVTFRF